MPQLAIVNYMAASPTSTVSPGYPTDQLRDVSTVIGDITLRQSEFFERVAAKSPVLATVALAAVELAPSPK